MKPKTIILMVVAVVCGLGASYMTSKLLADRGKGTEEPTATVVVAKAKVAPWTAIKAPDQQFEEKPYPQSLVPKKALTSLDQLKDQRLNKAVDEGKPLTEDDLLTATQIGLISKMKPGERAIAIRVNAESLVGGFILPGYRVDVVCTTRGGGDPNSKFILQDMLVLAVDAQTQRVDGQPHIMASTVTFAAMPEEVTRLALATTIGDLRLTPRAVGDTKRIGETTSRPSDLDKQLRPRSASADDGDDRQGGGIVSLPKAADLPPVDEKKPEAKAVDAPKVKKHRMIIRTPSTTTKVLFILGEKDEDDDEDDTTASGSGTPLPQQPAVTPQPPAAPARKDDKSDGKTDATQRQPPGTGLRRTGR